MITRRLTCLASFLWLTSAVTAAGQVISWDGGGDAVSWSDRLNWSGDQVPGPANDVVIAGGTGTSVVISSGSITVRSVQCSKVLTLSGGSFRVTTGHSELTGAFNISGGASLVVQGADASNPIRS